MKESSKYYNETVRDKLILSPLQKYVKYDRYPYKMVLSLALVILTTLATFNLLNIYSITGQAQIKVWKNVLGISKLEDTKGQSHFLSLDDFSLHLNNLVTNLLALDDLVFQKIDDQQSPEYFIEVVPLYPVADVILHRKNSENPDETSQNRSFFVDNYTYSVDLVKGILQPFNASSKHDIKRFLQRVHQFSFRIRNVRLGTNTKQGTVDFDTCWNVDLHYDFHEMAYIMATPQASFSPCKNEGDAEDDTDNDNGYQVESDRRRLVQNDQPSLVRQKKLRLTQLEYSEKFMGDSVITLHAAIFICAAISLILNLKYIYEMMQVYLQTLIKSKSKRILNDSIVLSEVTNENDKIMFQKKISEDAVETLEKLLETDKPWHMLTFREKMLFFDLWFILGIIGNMVQLWQSILVLATEVGSNDYHGVYVIEILIGFSCFLAWLNLIRYLEYNKSIFTISNIMRRSLPQMFLFIIGFVPIFLAYVFLGISLFWRYEKFKDPNEATMSLFSLIMGDSIFYFITTVKGYGLLSLIYFFSFLIVFFMAIQNIFVSIIVSKAQQEESEPNKPAEQTESPASVSPNRGSIEVRGESKPDISDLMIKQPRVLKKMGTAENLTVPIDDGFKPKGLTRGNTSAFNSNPDMLFSQMNSSRIPTLDRRVSNPMSVVPEEGPLKKLLRTVTLKARSSKDISKLRNIEELEFEKDRISVKVRYDTENALWILDDLVKENVTELEFYKLSLRNQVAIKKGYLQELVGLAAKLRDMIDLAKKMKEDLKNIDDSE